MSVSSTFVSDVLRFSLKKDDASLLSLLNQSSPTMEEKKKIAPILLAHASLSSLLQIKEWGYDEVFCEVIESYSPTSMTFPPSYYILLTTDNPNVWQDKLDMFLQKGEYISSLLCIEAMMAKGITPPPSDKTNQLMSFVSYVFVDKISQHLASLFEVQPWKSFEVWLEKNNLWGDFSNKLEKEVATQSHYHTTQEDVLALKNAVTKLILEHALEYKENSLSAKSKPAKKM